MAFFHCLFFLVRNYHSDLNALYALFVVYLSIKKKIIFMTE